MKSLVTLDWGVSFQNRKPVMPQIMRPSGGPPCSRRTRSC